MEKLKPFLIIFLFFISFGCAREPDKPELRKSMAEFDRVYVPALVFADLQNQRASEIAIDRLRFEWNKFHKAYYNQELKYGVDIVDKYWKEDFARIDFLISSAEALVKNKDLIGARENLEQVRFVFMDIRHRNGLDYFLDRISKIHRSIEEALESLKGKEGLRERDYYFLDKLSERLRVQWAMAGSAEIEADIFGFDENKVDAIRERISGEAEAVSNFRSAVLSMNESEVFQTSANLKPNFMLLYKAFGDFEPVFKELRK